MAVRDEKAVVEIILKGQQANATIKDIEKSSRALRAQLSRLPADSAEFEAKTRELQKVNGRLNKIREEIKGTGNMFQWLGKEVKAFGIIAVSALGFQWMTGQISQLISKNGELSDQVADMRKTTGMTVEEARTLNSTFSQMDTRTSTKELRNIAIAAGQLGIAKNDILRFTDATDKMVVALGDEFTGGAGEVTKTMGGLRTIFSDIKSARIDSDLLRIGNAVNELSASGAATGPVLTDFANRIGGVANSLGFTSAQTLGLSATLEELKVGTEKGSTATVKILQRMTTHVEEFAKIAGMSTTEFANLVNTDLFGAFTKVIEGSQKSGTSAVALGKILDSLGVDGAGASEVMTKLGLNMGLLKEKVALAGDSLKGTDSIMAEFSIKNKTLGADLEKLGKNIGTWFTNSAVSNGLKSLIGWMAELTSRSKSAAKGIAEEAMKVNKLVIEINEANTTNARRNEIYSELLTINPILVDGINKESISMAALNKNLEKYNENAQVRILIARKQAEIDEQNETSATALELKLKSEDSLRKRIVLALKEEGAAVNYLRDVNNRSDLTLLQKGQEMQKYLGSIAFKDGKVVNKDAYSLYQTLYSSVMQVANATAAYSQENLKANTLLIQQTQLQKDNAASTLQVLDYSKKTEAELNTYIQDNIISRGNWAKEAAAAKEELARRSTAKQLKSEVELTDAEKKELERRIEEKKKIHEKLMADLAAMRVENANYHLTDREKEYADVVREHEAMLERLNNDANASTDDYVTVFTNLNNKIEALNKKYWDQDEKERKEHLQAQRDLLNDSLQKELDAIKAKYEKEIEYNKKHNQDTKELEEKRDQEIQDALAKSLETETEKKDEGGYSTLFGKYKSADELRNKEAQLYRDVSTSAMALVEMDQQRRQNETNQEVKALDDKAKNDLAREKRLYDSKLISKEEYDTRTQEIERDFDSRKREALSRQFEYEKKISIAKIWIAGAEGAAKAIATYGPTPAGALGVLFAGGMAVAQTALVSSQEMPAYRFGGWHEPAGYTEGPAVYGSASGKPFIAGEAGTEYIVSNDMLQQGWVARSVAKMEAARTGRAFADGGYSASNGRGNNSSFGAPKDTAGGNDRLAVLIEHLITNGIEARLNYDTFQKDLSSIDSAANGSRVG